MTARTTAEKLLVKPGGAVWCSDPAVLERVGPLPADVRVVDGLADATVGILVAEDAASLRRLLAAESGRLTVPAALWVAYRKGGHGELNRDTVWPIVAEHGLRPIGQVAVDATWSALRFRPLHEGEEQFTGGRP